MWGYHGRLHAGCIDDINGTVHVLDAQHNVTKGKSGSISTKACAPERCTGLLLHLTFAVRGEPSTSSYDNVCGRQGQDMMVGGGGQRRSTLIWSAGTFGFRADSTKLRLPLAPERGACQMAHRQSLGCELLSADWTAATCIPSSLVVDCSRGVVVLFDFLPAAQPPPVTCKFESQAHHVVTENSSSAL